MATQRNMPLNCVTVAMMIFTSGCSNNQLSEPPNAIIVTSTMPDRNRPATITSIATNLGLHKKQQYIVAGSNETRCNLFVRDFVSSYFESPTFPREFQGNANQIFDSLVSSTAWDDFAIDEASLRLAQRAANEGTLAIIAYKNPADNGHGILKFMGHASALHSTSRTQRIRL